MSPWYWSFFMFLFFLQLKRTRCTKSVSCDGSWKILAVPNTQVSLHVPRLLVDFNNKDPWGDGWKDQVLWCASTASCVSMTSWVIHHCVTCFWHLPHSIICKSSKNIKSNASSILINEATCLSCTIQLLAVELSHKSCRSVYFLHHKLYKSLQNMKRNEYFCSNKTKSRKLFE